jgi:alkylation response protein AidB-like acyl-CoA dehydrogenase
VLGHADDRAAATGDHYVLNGRKTFIHEWTTSATSRLVYAKVSDPDHHVRRRAARSPVSPPARRVPKLGHARVDDERLIFDNCRVPAETSSAPMAAASRT